MAILIRFIVLSMQIIQFYRCAYLIDCFKDWLIFILSFYVTYISINETSPAVNLYLPTLSTLSFHSNVVVRSQNPRVIFHLIK